MNSNPHKPIIIWLFAGCFLVYAMVVIGGMTRLTHSGLSMVQWSPVGSLPPMNDAEWNEQFDNYKQSPEFKMLNFDFTIDDFKEIFWWEYIHRFIGRTIGVVFFAGFLFFWLKKKFPQGFIKKMLILLLIGAGQGLLGWFMVMSGLQKNPYVSHYRLAAHLIAALTAFGFTFWFALDLIYPERGGGNKSLRKFSLFLFSVVVVQIIYGAFVAGLKAGYMYNTFPKMGDQWFPDEMTALEPVWKNFTEGHAGVQFMHRYIAYAVVLLAGILFYRSRKILLSPLQRKLMNAVLVIVSLQFLLGVLTLLYGIPVFAAILHQTGAFFLFSTILFLIHRLR